MSELQLSSESTYKELNEVQLRNVLDYLVRLDQELGLANLSIDKLENEFIVDELAKRNDYHQKHMRQIASIVGHVEHLVSDASSNQSSSIQQTNTYIFDYAFFSISVLIFIYLKL